MEAMFSPRIQGLLAEAARPAREQIQRDAAKSTERRIRESLALLGKHLFDSAAKAQGLIRSQGIRDNNFSTDFRTKVGEPPAAYLRHRRLETAGRLLTKGELMVCQVAELVGFRSNRAFCQAFRAWSGMAPSHFQGQAAGAREVAQNSHGDRCAIEDSLDDRMVRAARSLLVDWISRDFRQLQVVEPSPQNEAQQQILSTPTKEINIPVDLMDLAIVDELPGVRSLWFMIQDMSYTEQVKALCERQAEFQTPALFYWLREASRIAARESPARGLQLAKLALVGARLIELNRFGNGASGLLVLAWSWLANQLRLQLSLEESGEAFDAAERFLPEGPWPLEIDLANGDFCYWKAHLYWFRREFSAAISLLDAAISCFRQAKFGRMLSESLLMRAVINHQRGRAELSLPDLHEAMQLLQPEEHLVQYLSAVFLLARVQLDCGNFRAAEDLAKELRGLAARFHRKAELLIQHFEGRIAIAAGDSASAEKILASTRAAFLDMDCFEHAAIASLDLAFLYSQNKNGAKAAVLAADAIPLFKRLSLENSVDALVACRLIKESAENLVLNQETADHVRRLLDQALAQHPAFLLDRISSAKFD